jgi:hypothetical protein
LSGAAVAIVLFDGQRIGDPMASIVHWTKVLKRSEDASGNTARKLLVATRMDHGPESVVLGVHDLIERLGFEKYVKTSAKENHGIAELLELIRGAIVWNELPEVSSETLFQQIKSFLVEQTSWSVLDKEMHLFQLFVAMPGAPKESDALREEFRRCVWLAESQGLVRRFRFGDLILLRPELLDVYASAILTLAQTDENGLGSVSEDEILARGIPIHPGEKAVDIDQEKLLLTSTIGELIRHEIALRESTENGDLLVFPSQFTRLRPEAPLPESETVKFSFQGAINDIYSTLVIRLSRSGRFSQRDLWKNAARFDAQAGGSCGVYLRRLDEEEAELALFFGDGASDESIFQFEEYVHAHLRRRASADSVRRRQIHVCRSCRTPFTDLQVDRRRKAGLDWIICGICEARVSLRDRREEMFRNYRSVVREMDEEADRQKRSEEAAQTIRGKLDTSDFDVFISYKRDDRNAVERIAKELLSEGILPWFDKWQMKAGTSVAETLEEQMQKVKTVAAFFGAKGRGAWQGLEIEAFLHLHVERGTRIIPVFLEDAPRDLKLSVFLDTLDAVDFRKDDRPPLAHLIWAINGKNPYWGSDGTLRNP